MKVLLVRPQAPNKLSFVKILDNEPLELEYLHTALLAAGYEDVIYDGLVEKVQPQAFMEQYQPEVVAITGYITQEKQMLRLCKEAKELLPWCTTVLGGVHAQLNYRRLQQDSVDYILRSESSDAFVELIRWIREKGSGEEGSAKRKDISRRLAGEERQPVGEGALLDRGHAPREKVDAERERNPLKEVNGLCWKKGGEWQNNALHPVDINSLPIPDRSFFYQHRKSYRYLELTEVGTIKTAFSCPYSCNFCYCTHLAGGGYQARDIELVLEELQHLDCRNVQIVDDDFLVDPRRLRQFIEGVKRRRIRKTYICYARADFVSEHPQLVRELAEIGFRYFLVGLEAINDEELQGYNKGTSAEHNARCVQVIQNAGAQCIALMIAPLDATSETFKNLYHWVEKNHLHYVTVSIFTPIPGTPLYEEYKERIISQDMEEWDFLHLVLEPEKLSRSEFYREYNWLFLKLYQRGKKMGIYDFMDLKFYYHLLKEYLRRKIQES